MKIKSKVVVALSGAVLLSAGFVGGVYYVPEWNAPVRQFIPHPWEADHIRVPITYLEPIKKGAILKEGSLLVLRSSPDKLAWHGNEVGLHDAVSYVDALLQEQNKRFIFVIFSANAKMQESVDAIDKLRLTKTRGILVSTEIE